MKEVWKDIKGYEQKYQVSNLGNIKSLARKKYNGRAYADKKEQILKPRINKHGYLHVNLYNGHKKYKDVEVQRLVAQTFLSNPNDLPYVNHKDEDKLNNNVSNLEWCDYAYNNNYGNHNLRMSIRKRDEKYKEIARKNGKKASKKVAQYTLKGKLLRIYSSQSEAARRTNSTQDGISNCCKGNYQKHNGYVWEYVEANYGFDD